MEKYLKTIEDFAMLTEGNVLERDENGNYVYSDSYENDDLRTNGISVKYDTKVVLSENFAKELIQDAVLEEVKEKDADFVNVFDEISKLRDAYVKDLTNVEKDMKNAPMCLQIEKTTVLSNLIKVLDHLYSLKK